MEKLKFLKIIASTLSVASVLMLTPIGVNAEWKQNNHGWWYAEEGNTWAVGWKLINGKWYYFNSEGYMAHDIFIDAYQIGSDGAWIQSTQNSSTNDEKSGTGTGTIEENSDSNVKNSDIIQSEFTSEGVTLKLEKSVYELGTKQIKFYFTNNTNKIQGCSPSYAVSKFENNKWYILSQFTKSFDKSIMVGPGRTEEGTVSLNVLKGFNTFAPGKYRIIKNINSTNFILEFELK